MFKTLVIVFAVFLGLTFNHQAWSLSTQDYAWIAQKIEHNETGGQDQFLVYWSEHEEFPSLGIGHFIWLPSGLNVPFESTFYSMVQFVSQTQPAPNWIHQPHAPWANKSEFDLEGQSDRVLQLTAWLQQTKALQAEFIVRRFEQRMQTLLAQNSNPTVQQNYQMLMQTPEGQFALIDYVNFKGLGDAEQERYQGEGWGVLQVLQTMTPPTDRVCAVRAFAQSAEQRLMRRVELAPIERNETRWLPGWRKRLTGYYDFKTSDCKELN